MNYINDIQLYNKINEDETNVNVVVEICPGTSDKNELVEPRFEKLTCVRQVVGKYPFYYGSFPQTYAGDKDPLDFILFTDKKHECLDVVKVDIIGAVKTVDAGEQDDKIICVESDSKLTNVKKQMKKALKFLKKYKGKKPDMKIEKKLASMSEAEELLQKAHEAWNAKIVTAKISKTGATRKASNTSRVKVVRR